MFELLLLSAALVSEIIGTMAGFGSSTIFLPLALLFLDFKTALVITAILHIFGNLGRITFFRHGIDQRLLLIFGAPSVVLTVLGALLVNYAPPATLKLILGVFLLLFAGVSLFKPSFHFRATKQNALIGGGLSGFFAGLIGTGGVLRGAFLTSFNLPKNIYIATAAAIALAVDLTRIPIYFGGGFLDSKYYAYLPWLFIMALVGSYLGKKIVDKIPPAGFKKIVLLAIMLVSVKFIYDGLMPWLFVV